MQPAYLGPPILVIMLPAAGWAWWSAVRRPATVAATSAGRARTTAIEGGIGGSVWSGIHLWVEHALTSEAVLNGVLVGCTWAGTAWWSRERIAAIRHHRWNHAPAPVRAPAAPRGQHQANGTVPHHVVHQTTSVHPAGASFRTP